MRKPSPSLSYADAGVDIDTADAAKRLMAHSLSSSSSRVLNSLGAFASLYDFHFPEMKAPVLVIKMEEPGSKQLLAAQHGRLPAIGLDLVHHIINDTIMMGARPLVLQDTIVCGKLEKSMVCELVDVMAEACRSQGCDLVGGETSEQPRVIPAGSYILSAACVGVVDRSHIIDGSKIEVGDVVLAVESSGVHTNGYTLVRSLLDRDSQLAESRVGSSTFLEQVLTPHRCYNLTLQSLFQRCELHGLAHITGGGIVDNLSRIVPQGLQIALDLSAVRIMEIFRAIQAAGAVPSDDMLRTFNLGVGMIIVAPQISAPMIAAAFHKEGVGVYQIGAVETGTAEGSSQPIRCCGALKF